MNLLTCQDCDAQFARTGFDELAKAGQVTIGERTVPARECSVCGGKVPFR